MRDEQNADFPRGAIDACLDRISRSHRFVRSPRLVGFLRFTVHSVLEGRADQIKERTIGVEAYGRPLAYDPRKDPIVRTEAHRLRRRLAAYYAQEGASDPIRIEVPKGQYVPCFGPNTERPESATPSCRLLVVGLEHDGADERAADQAVAMAEALRSGLAAWPGLEVASPETERPGMGRSGLHPRADYRVEGGLQRAGEQCAVAVRVVRLSDEKEVWSGTERSAAGRTAGMAALVERLVGSIAAALTRPARPSRPLRPAEDHTIDFFVKGRHSAIQYGNDFDPRHLERGRRRLAAALEREPEYVDALAELAHLELLCLYPPRGERDQVLARARALLERALAVAPAHARSLYLLGHVEGSALRPRAALQLTESAVAIDPDDPEGRTMLAVRYASLGFWESAVCACDWAVALDPVWEAPHRIKAYCLTRMGRLDAARLATEELARAGTAPFELAMARFDLRLAEGDLDGARDALANTVSTTELRPDQESRREIARALADALGGDRAKARAVLEAHGPDGPRFWDHTIRLALALGEDERGLEWLLANPINRSYRWLVAQSLARPLLDRPRWRPVVEELHADWLRVLEEVGPRLPAPPPHLPPPTPPSRRGASRPGKGQVAPVRSSL